MKNQNLKRSLGLIAVLAGIFLMSRESDGWVDAAPSSVHGVWTQVGDGIEGDKPCVIQISGTDVSITLWDRPLLQGNAEAKGRVVRARETNSGNVGFTGDEPVVEIHFQVEGTAEERVIQLFPEEGGQFADVVERISLPHHSTTQISASERSEHSTGPKNGVHHLGSFKRS